MGTAHLVLLAILLPLTNPAGVKAAKKTPSAGLRVGAGYQEGAAQTAVRSSALQGQSVWTADCVRDQKGQCVTSKKATAMRTRVGSGKAKVKGDGRVKGSTSLKPKAAVKRPFIGQGKAVALARPNKASPSPQRSPSRSPTSSPSPSVPTPSPPSPSPSPAPATYQLLWSDEFSGTSLDASKWSYQTGDGSDFGIPGWGNNELEYYTSSSNNVRVENDNLVIEARREPAGGYNYTSGRIRTFGTYAVGPIAYSTIRVEASIKVPRGDGLWPAFWMLASTNCPASCSGCGQYGGWAASGEIDIMEHKNNATWSQGTIHFGSAPPNNRMITGGTILPGTNGNVSMADDYHTYAVEWERKQIRWYLDGMIYQVAYSANGTATNGWYTSTNNAPVDAPFGDGIQQFHLILNLAVGGSYPQQTWLPVDQQLTLDQINATFNDGPQPMLVDYVRVWGK